MSETKKVDISRTVVTRVIKQVEFITYEDWLDIKLCVECAYVQTKDESLHNIATRLLEDFFEE